jgi:hypothetical protein
MSRLTAAVVVALTLNQAPLRGQDQDTVFTVNVASADVHQGPSNVTRVIGHAPQGTVLPISRNLGSWLKVAWPAAPGGIGYVHVTMGKIGPANARGRTANRAPRAPSAPAPATTPTSPRTRTAVENIAPRGQSSGKPISHIFGVGGLVGPMSTFGATARGWRNDHLGMQFALTRDAMTSDVAAGRVTSMQLEPGVVYALFDHVSDYFWVRPYVGSAVSFRHQTLSVPAPGAIEPASDNGVGFRVFGGTELTYASMLRFGLSLEVGYRRFPAPFAGFEAGPLSASIAGHWYIK